jgi:hypothetical protein
MFDFKFEIVWIGVPIMLIRKMMKSSNYYV